MFKELDPLLHSQLRLAVMSLLISVRKAEFAWLKEKTGATSGNLSIQIQKLRDAGYLEIRKSFRNNYPLTECSITNKGITAFENYVKTIQRYIEPE